MTEAEWMTSTDPAAMLKVLTADAADFYPDLPPFERGKATARKLRLFACASCSAISGPGHGIQFEERGMLGSSDLEWAERHATRWADAAPGSALRLFCTQDIDGIRAALFRCIFGNPWQAVPSVSDWRLCKRCRHSFLPSKRRCYRCPQCNSDGTFTNGKPPWLTPDVLALARAIYTERRFDDMPVLADALEDSGCRDEAVLSHLRGEVMEYNDGGRSYWHTDTSGPQLTPDRAKTAHAHVRGCWVLDPILGKS